MASRQTLKQVGEYVKEHPYVTGGAVLLITLSVTLPHLLSVPSRILREARKYIGIRETGSNNGWNDADFQNKMKSAGWWDSAEWCNFFVKMVFLQLLKPKSKSFEFWNSKLSGSTQTTWANLQAPSKYHKISSTPKRGSLVIYQHINDHSKGHIEIVEKVFSDGSYNVISGNSGFGDGTQGVVRTKRPASGIKGMTIHGFIIIKKL